MREVFLKKVSDETQSIYIGNDEVIVGHTDNSILVENKMDIFYRKWRDEDFNNNIVEKITNDNLKLIGDLSRVIIYLNDKYDGMPYNIIPTNDGWEFVLDTPSFLPRVKDGAIEVLVRDYKFLLDKLHKIL